MGFNSGFKGLNLLIYLLIDTTDNFLLFVAFSLLE